MVDYQTYPDLTLVELVKTSDQSAFTEIYNRYHAGVYNYLLGFVKDPFLAEDLVHEVFIKLWTIREKMHIQASFGAYLYRICHNYAINTLQKMAVDEKRKNQIIDHLRAMSATTEDLPGSDELEDYDRLLQEAIDSLPTQRKKVFILVRQQDRSYEEAARELGVSVNTIKDHMSQALKTLREFLNNRGQVALAIILIERLIS